MFDVLVDGRVEPGHDDWSGPEVKSNKQISL